ncbi:MAG: helix-turn-helix domain-containing protein [Cyclobacteriaceae bacterium]
MSAGQIFLIVISGLGVIHGLFLAIFLWTTNKGNALANRLLSLLLIVLSFRIGKSVFLEFLDNLDAKLIFIGLGTMMVVGPLFYLYANASADKSYSWTNKQLNHFIPSLLAILFGFWINENDLETLPKFIFLVLFISYYGHYLLYLIKTKKFITKKRKDGLSDGTFKLLKLLFYGLLIIWVAYVLNLFDELVPYVVGPVLYSIVAYVISFIVITKGYLLEDEREKYKTTRISQEQTELLFSKVNELIVDQKQFRDPELTLKSLSATLNVSTQVLSMVINQKSQKNFNAFVNQYRVEESIQLLNDTKYSNLSISAIAFEAGFNSISSFNSAFKKQTGKTPQAYRQQLTK